MEHNNEKRNEDKEKEKKRGEGSSHKKKEKTTASLQAKPPNALSIEVLPCPCLVLSCLPSALFSFMMAALFPVLFFPYLHFSSHCFVLLLQPLQREERSQPASPTPKRFLY